MDDSVLTITSILIRVYASTGAVLHYMNVSAWLPLNRNKDSLPGEQFPYVLQVLKSMLHMTMGMSTYRSVFHNLDVDGNVCA